MAVVDVDKGSFALPAYLSAGLSVRIPAGRIVQIKSKPLPIIHQVDAFRVMKVLA